MATKKTDTAAETALEEIAKVETVEIETVEKTETKAKTTLEKKQTKTYADEDLIECRSITRGELILIGKKSKNRYVFSNYDDTCEIEVRDLNASRASKSMYLFEPLFVIEDEEFVSQPKWKELKKMYDETMISDVNEILDRPLREFKMLLTKLPKGYQRALCDEAATRIRNDEFDSLGKIKAIDEVCGTDLYCLIR